MITLCNPHPSTIICAPRPRAPCIYDFINAWLEPKTADYIVNAWGYGHSNMVEMGKMSEEDLSAVGLNTSEKLRDNTLWQGPVPAELREKMIAEFELIKAGF